MEKNILIENDFELKCQDRVKLHITYDTDLTLMELSDIISLVNQGINDINRDNGVSSNLKIGKEYPSTVSAVHSGSIVLEIVTNFVIPLTVSLLANYIYNQLKKNGAKGKRGKAGKYPVSISVAGENNNVNIHIHNGK